MQNKRISRWMGGLACAALLALAGCTSITSPSANGTATPGATGTGTPGATNGTPGAGTGTPGAGGGGPQLVWGSLLYDSTTGRTNPLDFTNMNPASGKSAKIASVPVSNQGGADSISPNGQLVAYHVQNGSSFTYSAASIAGLSQPQSLGQVNGAVGTAIWKHDNAHLAVSGNGQITILGAGQQPQQILNVHATQLIAFSSDDSSLFYVAAGDAPGQTPGALYRLALSNPSQPVLLTPREFNSHFILSPDGQTVYYNNTSTSGSQGIYSVSAQNGGTPALVRQTAGVPVGFTSGGALLYVLSQSSGVALMKLNSGGVDATITGNLVTGSATIPNLTAGISVAPDGNGVAALGALSSGGDEIFFTDLTVASPQPKMIQQLTQSSRADLIGFDTALLAAGS
jgi:hypothetical protein